MVAEAGLSVSIKTGRGVEILSKVYNELKFQRARSALAEYCQQHNAHRAGVSWAIESSPPCLLLVEVDGCNQSVQPQLKCCLEGESWFIYVPGCDDAWRAYPNLPQVSDYELIIKELERAPLHVHWG